MASAFGLYRAGPVHLAFGALADLWLEARGGNGLHAEPQRATGGVRHPRDRQLNNSVHALNAGDKVDKKEGHVREKPKTRTA